MQQSPLPPLTSLLLVSTTWFGSCAAYSNTAFQVVHLIPASTYCYIDPFPHYFTLPPSVVSLFDYAHLWRAYTTSCIVAYIILAETPFLCLFSAFVGSGKLWMSLLWWAHIASFPPARTVYRSALQHVVLFAESDIRYRQRSYDSIILHASFPYRW